MVSVTAVATNIYRYCNSAINGVDFWRDNSRKQDWYFYWRVHKDVQIGFDYNGLPEKVVWKEFTKRFGEDASSNLKLDCVLQYVAFPRVEVTSKGRLSNLKQDQSHQAVNGRQDMKYYFDWL